MSDPNLNDDELEALMAELEAQNAEIAAANTATAEAKPVAAEASAVEDEPVAEAEAEEPPVEDAAPVEAVQAEAATDQGIDEDDLAALQAELEAEQAEATTVPAAAVTETVPADLTPTSDQEATIPLVKDEATGKLSTPGSAALSDVALTEPSATRAAPSEPPVREEPRRPTEATGAGNLKHYIDVDQFRDDTRVSEANLDKCMIEQNGMRAWYGAEAARAEAQAARVKAKFEVVEATLYDHHRKELAKSGEKTTEKMVENAVKLDPRWLKAKNMVIEAETIATINKGLVESIKDRRDMIIQLGADRRDEYKGAARVLAEQGQRDDLRDRAVRAMQGTRAA
jgi:hypothetical protein